MGNAARHLSPVYSLSAFMTMAIILLHMFWGVVFFDACEKQRWWAVAAVVISHLVVSCLVSDGGGAQTFELFLCGVDLRFLSGRTDLPEPRICRQPGSNIRHLVPDGNLGVLLCRRLPPEPQTLPHLQRQRFPPSKPQTQITQQGPAAWRSLHPKTSESTRSD